MKVCYINPAGYGLLNPSYVRKQTYGGAEAATLDDAMELACDKTFDTHLLVDADEEKKFKTERINVWTLKGSFTDNKSFIRYRYAFWKKLKEINADIYVQRASLGELYLLTALFCKLNGKKYVHIISETEEVMRAKLKNASLLGRIRWTTLVKAALGMADAIVAISKQQLNTLSPALHRKTRVIYNGKKIAKSARPFQERKYILWAGRNHPVKKPKLFLRLARQLSDKNFVMTVIGAPIKNAPPNVKIFYNVPRKKMNSYFASAQLLVHTALPEGFGNVYIEAWNNGTPVVTTADTDELVCRHNLGKHSNTFEQLVKDTRESLNEKNWRIQSSNARNYAKTHHDIKVQIRKYKELFTSPASAQER